MTEPSFLIAFIIGILSFLAPCTLPVLPGYFSYLAGLSQDKQKSKKKIKIFVTALSFVSGFLIVLVLLGATASFIGQFLLRNKSLWEKISGLIIIFFGLQIMGALRLRLMIPILTIPDRLNISSPGSIMKGKAFFAGASFGIGWTPCIGPILGSILILASQMETIGKGIILLIFYALGLGIPLLLSGFFWSQLTFLKNKYVPFVSGSILIFLGTLLFFNQYSKLTIRLAKIYIFFKIPIY